MKKILISVLFLALLLGAGVCASASGAQVSAQNLSVNGQAVKCEKYNIDGSNYFKLRDLAKLLNGTGSQFDVGWDASANVVTITTSHAYTTPNGQELVVGKDNSATAKISAQTIKVDGKVVSDLTVYNIGGSNYFKLREMGDKLGFDVDYNAASNTAIVTSKGEAPAPAAQPAPTAKPDPAAFDFLVKKIKEEGELENSGNYSLFLVGTKEDDTGKETSAFYIDYDPKTDTLEMIDFYIEWDSAARNNMVRDHYITVEIPRSLSSPYHVTHIVSYNDDQYQLFYEGDIDPALLGENTISIPAVKTNSKGSPSSSMKLFTEQELTSRRAYCCYWAVEFGTQMGFWGSYEPESLGFTHFSEGGSADAGAKKASAPAPAQNNNQILSREDLSKMYDAVTYLTDATKYQLSALTYLMGHQYKRAKLDIGQATIQMLNARKLLDSHPDWQADIDEICSYYDMMAALPETHDGAMTWMEYNGKTVELHTKITEEMTAALEQYRQ